MDMRGVLNYALALTLDSGVSAIINYFVDIIRAFNKCIVREVNRRLDRMFDSIVEGDGRAVNRMLQVSGF